MNQFASRHFGLFQKETRDPPEPSPISHALQQAVLDPKTKSKTQSFMARRAFNKIVGLVQSRWCQTEISAVASQQSSRLVFNVTSLCTLSILQNQTFLSALKNIKQYIETGVNLAHDAFSLQGVSQNVFQCFKGNYQIITSGVNKMKPLTAAVSPGVISLFITPFSLFLGCVYKTMMLNNKISPGIQSTVIINVARELLYRAYLFSCAAGTLLNSGSTLMMLSSAIGYASDALLLCESSLGLSAMCALAISHLEIFATAIFFTGYSVLAIGASAAILSLLTYTVIMTLQGDIEKPTPDPELIAYQEVEQEDNSPLSWFSAFSPC